MKWRVGSGTNISLVGDRWIPHFHHTPVDNSLAAACHDITVSSLIDHEKCEWDFELVDSIFFPEVAAAVKSIPLSLFVAHDELYWWPSNDGIFSVKSAYKLGVLGVLACLDSDVRDPENLWSKILSLNTIPKLKHFLWRFGNWFLAAFDRLRERRIRVDGLCPRCHNAPETILHATLLCPSVNDVWSKQELASLIYGAPLSSPADLLLWSIDKLDEKKCLHVLAAVWTCWSLRNISVHSDQIINAEFSLNGFTKLALEPKNGNAFFSPAMIREPRTLSLLSWTAHPVGLIKLNSDAGLLDGGVVGIGCVARDHDGNILAMAAKRIQVNWDAKFAEFAATRLSIHLAARLGMRKVILESDNLSVISALQHKKQYLNEVFHFVNDIRMSVPSFDTVLASHVKRGKLCSTLHC